MFIKKITSIGLFSLLILPSISVQAQDISQKYPLSREDTKLQNSKTYMSSIATFVPNPKNRMCNSVVDCRKKGQNLDNVLQFKGTDFSKKSHYPLSTEDRRHERRLNYWAKK